MYFAGQCFTVDPATVAQATQASISGVDLFFRARPDATVNRSGITNPGATVYLVPASNGVPVALGINGAPRVRVEFEDINIPGGGHSLPSTHFAFDNPVLVQTGTEYAFVVQFDGSEDFDLWCDVKGWQIENDSGDTTTLSPGVRNPRIGQCFAWSGAPTPVLSPNSNASVLLGEGDSVLLGFYAATASTLLTTTEDGDWTELHDTVLTFKIYAARWAVSGNAIAVSSNGAAVVTGEVTTTDAGNARIILPSRRYEYCLLDHTLSGINGLLMGERVYQNTVFAPGGTSNYSTLSVVNGSNVVTYSGGAAINFNSMFNLAGSDAEWVVITSQNHDGPNADVVCVRQVASITSNTSFTVTEPVNYTNSAATFFRSPTAVLDQVFTGKIFGSLGVVAVLVDSSANATMRFVNNSILSSAIAANGGGTGYSNTDYVTFSGFENVAGKVLGGYVAVANIVTNGNGTITGLFLSNLGCGFINTSAVSYAITNSSALASSGTGANLTFTTGSIVKTEHLGQTGSGGYFIGSTFINLEVGEESPRLAVSNPGGTFYTTSQRLPYYGADDGSVYSTRTYFCDPDGQWDEFQVQDFSLTQPWALTKRRILPSWSNEWNIPYANGAPCGAKGGSTSGNSQPLSSNSSVLLFDLGANTDFSSIQVRPGETSITYSRYIINNDYTLEETDNGDAFAKGVETKVNLANGSFAEDIRVYATAHRPAGTDVLAYVRFYNSHDSEAVDDKDWTKLQVITGNGVFSGAQSPNDFMELTWGLPANPNTGAVLAGVVTTTANNNNLVGVGTTWTSQVSNGELVVLRSGLFPNNYQVAVVNAVVNDTFISLYSPVSNLDMVGTGFNLAVCQFPHQAFSNYLNDNVVRYYSQGMVEYDTFDVFQLKIVFTSNSSTIVPYIDDVRAEALSA